MDGKPGLLVGNQTDGDALWCHDTSAAAVLAACHALLAKRDSSLSKAQPSRGLKSFQPAAFGREAVGIARGKRGWRRGVCEFRFINLRTILTESVRSGGVTFVWKVKRMRKARPIFKSEDRDAGTFCCGCDNWKSLARGRLGSWRFRRQISRGDAAFELCPGYGFCTVNPFPSFPDAAAALGAGNDGDPALHHGSVADGRAGRSQSSALSPSQEEARVICHYQEL
jgi:hypothetical protein